MYMASRCRFPIECPICFEDRRPVTLHPCGHQFCAFCLRRQLERCDTARCAMCRCDMYGCVPSIARFPVGTRRLLLRFVGPLPEEGLGISLQFLEGNVVRVARVSKAGYAARGGLQTGDQILALNGLPCNNQCLVNTLLKTLPDETLTLHFLRSEAPEPKSTWWTSCLRSCVTAPDAVASSPPPPERPRSMVRYQSS